ncbi:MAG TPA: ATP-binding protein [Polyangia bacterium]|jgi:two-component system sensor histidine kinase ChvG
MTPPPPGAKAPGPRPPGLLDWLFRIRYRLLLVNLLIVSVPLVGIGFARFYEREMLRSLEQDMAHQGQLLRQALVDDSGGLRLDRRGPMLAAAARDTRTRIRLLDTDGRTVADSHQAGPPEGRGEQPPHLLPTSLDPRGRRVAPRARPKRRIIPIPVETAARAEVAKALRGQYGAATRVWERGDRVFLFAAVPIIKDAQVQGVVYVTRSTNPVRAAMHRLRATLLKVLLGAVGATAVLSLFLAWTISRPLGRLTRLAARIAAGDRTAQLALERRDEIGQLARAFDAMTRRLDERARYIGELSANISHEFKSPLTSIRGAAELLLDGAAEDPGARARFLENILADSQRLDRLVTRLLELSRVEADPVPTEVLDYEALVREAADHASGAAPVEVHYRARAMHLLGRRAHLASVVGNLVDNAQAFAAPGTTITITVAEADGGAALRTSVHNLGAPISEANLERIWHRFFTTRAQAGGTGLGLPIVASVVSAHGGTVAVTSSAAEGTTFSFELPAARG